jgi:ankyrin repeat protein
MEHASIEKMLLNGADPNAVAARSITPLLLAIMKGDEALVELLLKHGADPNTVGRTRSTITWAKRKRQDEVTEILRK